MLTIAGGIVLGVLALIALPFVLGAAVWLICWGFFPVLGIIAGLWIGSGIDATESGYYICAFLGFMAGCGVNSLISNN